MFKIKDMVHRAILKPFKTRSDKDDDKDDKDKKKKGKSKDKRKGRIKNG